jgi:glycosyltransferase involved in cell wall biosynthesis
MAPNTPQRVGIVHVPYQVRGGEDVLVETLEGAYGSLGIETVRLPSGGSGIGAAASALFRGHAAAWDAFVEREKPSFLHLHNIHPGFGPAFLRWLAARGLPALYTIHNHRFYCTNGLALREDATCRDCREDPSALRPMLRNCNDSLAKSAYHALALREIRSEGLLERATTTLLAPSRYIADELARAGVRAKVRVFPHGVDLRTGLAVAGARGADVLFVGRLSEEKGVRYLLAAAALLPEISFLVVGEGPLLRHAQEFASTHKNVRVTGKIAREAMLNEMKVSKVACVPSLCEESFSLVAAEALSLGLGLVVADSESLRDYSREFGALTADPRDPAALAEALSRAVRSGRRPPEETAALRERFGMAAYARRLGALLEELGL